MIHFAPHFFFNAFLTSLSRTRMPKFSPVSKTSRGKIIRAGFTLVCTKFKWFPLVIDKEWSLHLLLWMLVGWYSKIPEIRLHFDQKKILVWVHQLMPFLAVTHQWSVANGALLALSQNGHSSQSLHETDNWWPVGRFLDLVVFPHNRAPSEEAWVHR